MIRTATHYSYWAVLMIALLGVLQSLYANYQIGQSNSIITQLNQGKGIDRSLDKTDSPELHLAYGSYLKSKHRYDEAQASLSQIIDRGDNKTRAISRYNLGNTYLAQAIELAESMQINEATSLASLAKQSYRQALEDLWR